MIEGDSGMRRGVSRNNCPQTCWGRERDPRERGCDNSARHREDIGLPLTGPGPACSAGALPAHPAAAGRCQCPQSSPGVVALQGRQCCPGAARGFPDVPFGQAMEERKNPLSCCHRLPSLELSPCPGPAAGPRRGPRTTHGPRRAGRSVPAAGAARSVRSSSPQDGFSSSPVLWVQSGKLNWAPGVLRGRFTPTHPVQPFAVRGLSL